MHSISASIGLINLLYSAPRFNERDALRAEDKCMGGLPPGKATASWALAVWRLSRSRKPVRTLRSAPPEPRSKPAGGIKGFIKSLRRLNKQRIQRQQQKEPVTASGSPQIRAGL